MIRIPKDLGMSQHPQIDPLDDLRRIAGGDATGHGETVQTLVAALVKGTPRGLVAARESTRHRCPAAARR